MSSRCAVLVIAGLIALTAIAGCTAAAGRGTAVPSSDQSSLIAAGISTAQPISYLDPIDVTGVWEGTRIDGCGPIGVGAGRCNAVMNLGLTILQDGDRISGFYRCSINTVNCFNMNETGAIKYGQIRPGLLIFRVMLDDGSSCIFHSVPQSDRMSGGFICLQGAAVVERGRWRVERSY